MCHALTAKISVDGPLVTVGNYGDLATRRAIYGELQFAASLRSSHWDDVPDYEGVSQ